MPEVVEIYKPVRAFGERDYSKHYEASNLGNVRSRRRGAKPLSPIVRHSSGHLAAVLTIDQRQTCHHVSKLVCVAWHGRPPTPRHQAAHRNGIASDNRPENLYWALPRTNAKDAMRHGTLGGPRLPTIVRAVQRFLAEDDSALVVLDAANEKARRRGQTLDIEFPPGRILVRVLRGEVEINRLEVPEVPNE